LSDIYHSLLTTSHRAKATHDFLQNVVPDLISAKECPTRSPDLNPLDYSVWDILQLCIRGAVNLMQTYVNWESIKTKMERDQWQTI